MQKEDVLNSQKKGIKAISQQEQLAMGGEGTLDDGCTMQTKKQQQSQQTSKKIAIRLCQKTLLLSILAFSTTGLTLEAQTQESVFYKTDNNQRTVNYFPITQHARNFMSLNLESVISVNVTEGTKFFKAGTTVSPNILWAGMRGNNGRVGIGTNAPEETLHVDGNVKISSTKGNDNPTLKIHSKKNTDDDFKISNNYGTLQFLSDEWEYSADGEMASISVGVSTKFGNHAQLKFSVNKGLKDDDTVSTELMRLNFKGLGIFTKDPQAPLHVNGNVILGKDDDSVITINGTLKANKFVDKAGNEIDAASLSKENIDSWKAAVLTANMITRSNVFKSKVFNEMAIGKMNIFGNWVGIAHNELIDEDSYALIQSNTGTTNINAAKNRPIYFKIDNKAKMVLHGDKLGIGPDFDIENGVIPEERLHVEGNVTVNGTVSAKGFGFGENFWEMAKISQGKTVLRIPGTKKQWQYIIGERWGETFLSRDPDKSIQFKRGNSMTDMVITGNKGLVGIGTTDPKSLLHVNGPVRANSYLFGDKYPHLIKTVHNHDMTTDGNNDRPGNKMMFYVHPGRGTGPGWIDTTPDELTITNEPVLTLWHHKPSDGIWNRKVGIGTDTPEETLHVSGNVKISSTKGNDNPTLKIHSKKNDGAFNTSNNYGTLQFLSDEWEYRADGEMASISVGVSYKDGNHAQLKFSVNKGFGSDNTKSTELMRLNNEGLGIFTKNPQAPLHVDGNVILGKDDDSVITINGTLKDSSGEEIGTGKWGESDNNIHYSGGNVGIGIEDPQAPLHVNGTVKADLLKIGERFEINENEGRIKYSDSKGGTKNDNNSFWLGNLGHKNEVGFGHSNGGNVAWGFAIGQKKDGNTIVNALKDKDILFMNHRETELMRLKPNGWLGIGASDPKALLHVSGNVKMSSLHVDFGSGVVPFNGSFNKVEFFVEPGSTSLDKDSDVPNFIMVNDDIKDQRSGFGIKDPLATLHVHTPEHPAYFIVDGAADEKLIDPDTLKNILWVGRNSSSGDDNVWEGRVGIGTDKPAAKLEVNGTVQAQSFNLTSGKQFNVSNSTGANYWLYMYDSRITKENMNEFYSMSSFIGNQHITAINAKDQVKIKIKDNEILDISDVSITSKKDLFVEGSVKANESIRIRANGEKKDDVAALYLGTPHNNLSSVPEKAAIFAVGIDSFSRSKLVFALNNEAQNYSSTKVKLSDHKMTIKPNGNVGIGTNDPSYRLHVIGTSKLDQTTFNEDGMTQMGMYAGLELPLLEVRKENFIANGERLRLGSGDLSVSGAADAKDLAYGVSVVHAPLASNAADAGAMQVALFTDKGTLDDAHYLDFVDAGTQEIVGSILGQELSLSSGAVKGVKLESTGADYAEYLLKVSAKEKIGPGSVVGVFNGKVSLKTKGADRVMVVSTMPLVVGNKRPEMTAGSSVAVAFVGQVPVRVVGAVRSGDYVIASGKHNGTAVAVSPENLTISDVKHLIGRAWETQRSKREKVVTVGISPFDFPATLLEKLEDKVETRFKAIEGRLGRLEG